MTLNLFSSRVYFLTLPVPDVQTPVAQTQPEQRVKEIIVNAVRIEQVVRGGLVLTRRPLKASVLLRSYALWPLGVPYGGPACEAHWDELHFDEAVHYEFVADRLMLELGFSKVKYCG